MTKVKYSKITWSKEDLELHMVKRRFGTARVQRRTPNDKGHFLNVEALNFIMDPILTPIICPFMKGNHPFNS